MVLALIGLVGCGEAPRPEGAEVPADFTRADHLRCNDWPVCPAGIVSPANHYLLRVFPVACRAESNFPITCGACMDTRTPACAPFVGKCIAPNAPTVEPDYCAQQLAPVAPVQGWTICTGADDGSPTGPARVVCEDDPAEGGQ